MKKISLFTLLFFILFGIYASFITAQSPYEFDNKKDGVFLLCGAGLQVVGLYYNNNITPLTDSEINNLSKSEINSFDRFATSYWSKGAQQISDVLLVAYGILPATLLVSKDVRENFKDISLLYLETALLTLSLNNTTKGVTQRIRPFVYNSNPNILLKEKTNKDAKRSFYSGHTTFTFASAVFTSMVFGDYFPGSKWEPVVWSTTLLGATATAILRIKGGKHYPTDVLVGAFIGSLTGCLVPYFHRNNKDRRSNLVPASSRKQLLISLNYRF